MCNFADGGQGHLHKYSLRPQRKSFEPIYKTDKKIFLYYSFDYAIGIV